LDLQQKPKMPIESAKLKKLAPLLAIAILLEAGCASQSTNPNVPPAITTQANIQNVNKLLADTINSANKEVIALRDQGKVTEADTRVIQNYCVIAATFSEAINTIINSALSNGDAMTVERNKIIALIQQTALPVISNNVSPTAAAVAATVSAVFTQLKGLVGL
jgi:hypothetical protein